MQLNGECNCDVDGVSGPTPLRPLLPSRSSNEPCIKHPSKKKKKKDLK